MGNSVFTTPFICDRRLYNKKGRWKNPNQDVDEPIFYFEKEPLTLESIYENGREEIKETLTIVVFGARPIIAYDKIVLENGKEYCVSANGVTYNAFEPNILVRDMLKPRYTSMVLVLE